MRRYSTRNCLKTLQAKIHGSPFLDCLLDFRGLLGKILQDGLPGVWRQDEFVPVARFVSSAVRPGTRSAAGKVGTAGLVPRPCARVGVGARAWRLAVLAHDWWLLANQDAVDVEVF